MCRVRLTDVDYIFLVRNNHLEDTFPSAGSVDGWKYVRDNESCLNGELELKKLSKMCTYCERDAKHVQ